MHSNINTVMFIFNGEESEKGSNYKQRGIHIRRITYIIVSTRLTNAISEDAMYALSVGGSGRGRPSGLEQLLNRLHGSHLQGYVITGAWMKLVIFNLDTCIEYHLSIMNELSI